MHDFKIENGFSLLEVLIALSIMVIAFTTLIGTQRGHVQLSIRGKMMTTAVMLARQKLTDAELQIRTTGLPLNDMDERKKIAEHPFGDDFPEFGYEYTVKKVQIPLPGNLGGGAGDAKNAQAQAIAQSAKAISHYLSQAVREARLRVYWETGRGEDQVEIVTHFVDLNASFGIQ